MLELINYSDSFQSWKEKINKSFTMVSSMVGGTSDPVGTMRLWHAGISTPDGWLLCDNRSLNKVEYSELYGVIGDTYTLDTTVNTNTFMLPKIEETILDTGKLEYVEYSQNHTSFSIHQKTNDIWSITYGANVRVLRGGVGTNWVDTDSGVADWRSICVNQKNGDVWVGGFNGEIKVLRGGTNTFVSTGSGNSNWFWIDIHESTGDVWACGGLDIKVLRGGVGTWQTVATTNVGSWQCIVINQSNGDVWACEYGGEVKVLRGGTNTFVSTSSGNMIYVSLSINPNNGDIWAGVWDGPIRILKGGVGKWGNIDSSSVKCKHIIPISDAGDMLCTGLTSTTIYKHGNPEYPITIIKNKETAYAAYNSNKKEIYLTFGTHIILKYTITTIPTIIKSKQVKKNVGSNIFVGQWVFLRQNPLPSGYVALNGTLYTGAVTKFPDLISYLTARTNELTTEADWQARSAAASGSGGVPFYVYDAAANTLRMPDTRGDSPYYGTTGTWQGDATRNIKGTIGRPFTYLNTTTAPFYYTAGTGYAGGNGYEINEVSMDISKSVPTDTTNHPRRIGMTMAVYAGTIGA